MFDDLLQQEPALRPESHIGPVQDKDTLRKEGAAPSVVPSDHPEQAIKVLPITADFLDNLATPEKLEGVKDALLNLPPQERLQFLNQVRQVTGASALALLIHENALTQKKDGNELGRTAMLALEASRLYTNNPNSLMANDFTKLDQELMALYQDKNGTPDLKDVDNLVNAHVTPLITQRAATLTPEPSPVSNNQPFYTQPQPQSQPQPQAVQPQMNSNQPIRWVPENKDEMKVRQKKEKALVGDSKRDKDRLEDAHDLEEDALKADEKLERLQSNHGQSTKALDLGFGIVDRCAGRRIGGFLSLIDHKENTLADFQELERKAAFNRCDALFTRYQLGLVDDVGILVMNRRPPPPQDALAIFEAKLQTEKQTLLDFHAQERAKAGHQRQVREPDHSREILDLGFSFIRRRH